MPELNVIADTSHHNGTMDFSQAKNAGLWGVIQKATQGEAYVDRTFIPNREHALAVGLRFGAYHFGTGANGVSQATHFLETVQLQPGDRTTVLVLDFEDNHAGTSMTLEEARAFVTHVHDKLGRWPGFYSGHTIKNALGTTVDPILKNCWFWLHNMDQHPLFRRAGRNGHSGNTLTGGLVRSRTVSRA